MNKGLHIQAYNTPVFWLVLLLIFTASSIKGQMSVLIGEQFQCANADVLIPVDVSDFNDVAAFTFYIQIDTLAVEFIDVLNPHVQLAGGGIISNFIQAGSYIVITWQSMLSASISNGKLFDVKVHYHEGNSGLIFLDNCEIALSDLTIVEDVIYEDGLLIPAIQINGQPQDLTVTEGQQAQFEISLQNYGEQEYRWQQHNGTSWIELDETAPFSGVFSKQLIIENVTLAMNNDAFRCKVQYNDCFVLSDSAQLTVSPLTIVNFAGNNKQVLKVFPNPTDKILHYMINSEGSNFNFQLLNLLGEVVVDVSNCQPEGSISLENVRPGIYFLRLSGMAFTNKTVRVVKR